MCGSRDLAFGSLFVVFTVALAGAQAAPPETKAEELSAAARRGDAATVKKLLDDGVDPNTKFRYNATALFYACDHGHVDVVKVLLDRGADVNAKDTFYGFTPLMLAVGPAQKKKPAHTEIAKLLIARGAQGKDQALSGAVSNGDTALAKVILESGGLPVATLSDALESAKEQNKTDMVTLLEQSGAKPYEDFKMDDAQLARYAGTYRGPTGNEVVFTVTGTRLTGGPAGQRLTLVATEATKFRVIGRPTTTVVFQVTDGKVTGLAVTQGENTTNFTRVEGK